MNTSPLSSGTPRRKIPWTFVIAVILAVVLLYLALRNVDWDEMLTTLRSGRVEFLAAGAASLVFAYLLRSLRWRVLLTAEKPLSVETVFWGTWVGYLGNAVLPARAGELIRSFLIARRGDLNVAYVLATAVTERIFDAIVLVLLVFGSVFALPSVPDWLTNASLVMGVVGIVGIIALFLTPRLEPFFRGILMRLPLPHGLREKLLDLMSRFLVGMRAFQQPRRALFFTALTIVIWSVDVIVAMCVAGAFGMTFTIPQTLLLLAALGLSSAAPSTPGYVGIYQFVAVTVLPPFGFTESQAIAFILAFQAVTYLMVLFWGGVGLWRLNVRRSELFTPQTAAESSAITP
ncbi:flippase-like domain-containing protein [Anaerolineae bacterium CFX9]|nr:flippase-like domain-containing protein [Anaerolineae bacterium CFX9]